MYYHRDSRRHIRGREPTASRDLSSQGTILVKQRVRRGAQTRAVDQDKMESGEKPSTRYRLSLSSAAPQYCIIRPSCHCVSVLRPLKALKCLGTRTLWHLSAWHARRPCHLDCGNSFGMAPRAEARPHPTHLSMRLLSYRAPSYSSLSAASAQYVLPVCHQIRGWKGTIPASSASAAWVPLTLGRCLDHPRCADSRKWR